MLTHKEIRTILAEHYTVEELCDILELKPSDIVSEFSCKINDMYDEIMLRIAEDLGWETDNDEE